MTARKPIDKSKWGHGPWQNEPDEWKHDDLPIYALRHQTLGHWCGYAKVDKDHPYYGLDYHDVSHSYVHGGLTHSGDTDDGMWEFGFDCAHAYDITPGSIRFDTPLYGETYRDLAYVKGVCLDLHRQLTEASDDPGPP